MFRSISIILALCLATVTAQASLLYRAGGQAYYDDVLDITWVADANLAYTAHLGGGAALTNSIQANQGAMNWVAAQNAIVPELNAGGGYLGVHNWRLPTVDLTTDIGEMDHLFYITLGNAGCGFDETCGFNSGPFSNVITLGTYWTSTPLPYPNYSDLVYTFTFPHGRYVGQSNPLEFEKEWAWFVRDGDIGAAVPIPPAVLLFGSALGVMGAMRRKISS